ncbi:MAG: hypothetical protein HKP36_03235 [Myxococcales bacterium]|nr:hypothetical protein [Deltaproteobacteria bacterium]NNL23445.1 hypothetical protein [Myxococcales bacterium]
MKNAQEARVEVQQVGFGAVMLLLLAAYGLPACAEDSAAPVSPTEPSLSFFVTSVGTGSIGGNVGGLAGADALCQTLGAAVGAGGKTWHAYLSSTNEDARDRIGAGPWYNARLQAVAANVDELHQNGIPRLLWGVTEDADGEGLVIDENGDLVPLAEHDIVTGSNAEGTVSEGRTCLDWTSGSGSDVAQVGHSDIAPPGFAIDGVDIQSWNSAHETASCTEEGLAERQGAGRFYCFAID